MAQNIGTLELATFHLKTEPHGSLQYGLIAEEVAQVYPDLVIRDESGTIQGVRYDELAPLLLNEVQRQHRTLTTQNQRLAAQDTQLHDLQQQLNAMKDLNAATQAAVLQLQAARGLAARR